MSVGRYPSLPCRKTLSAAVRATVKEFRRRKRVTGAQMAKYVGRKLAAACEFS